MAVGRGVRAGLPGGEHPAGLCPRYSRVLYLVCSGRAVSAEYSSWPCRCLRSPVGADAAAHDGAAGRAGVGGPAAVGVVGSVPLRREGRCCGSFPDDAYRPATTIPRRRLCSPCPAADGLLRWRLRRGLAIQRLRRWGGSGGAGLTAVGASSRPGRRSFADEVPGGVACARGAADSPYDGGFYSQLWPGAQVRHDPPSNWSPSASCTSLRASPHSQ